jgi:quinol monooxygenase YgiN
VAHFLPSGPEYQVNTRWPADLLAFSVKAKRRKAMTKTIADLVDHSKGLALEKVEAQTHAVSVFGSFTVMPFSFKSWLEVWEEVGRIARQQEACTEFRLFRKRNDQAHCFFSSRWDSEESSQKFFRSMNLPWIERNSVYSILPTHFFHYEQLDKAVTGWEPYKPELYEELTFDE